MKSFFGGLVAFFYAAIFIAIGVGLVLSALNVISVSSLGDMLNYLATVKNLKLIIGVLGGLFILISLLSLNITISRLQREKTIAFDNPDGQVTISLTAIEDFVKKIVRQIPDIKEIRPNIIASKKGIFVTARVILYSDTNIPAVTDNIQNLIKNKIQDILGIEETVTVRVHIAKITHREETKAPPKKDQTISYRGIEYST